MTTEKLTYTSRNEIFPRSGKTVDVQKVLPDYVRNMVNPDLASQFPFPQSAAQLQEFLDSGRLHNYLGLARIRFQTFRLIPAPDVSPEHKKHTKEYSGEISISQADPLYALGFLSLMLISTRRAGRNVYYEDRPLYEKLKEAVDQIADDHPKIIKKLRRKNPDWIKPLAQFFA